METVALCGLGAWIAGLVIDAWVFQWVDDASVFEKVAAVAGGVSPPSRVG